MGHPAPHAAEKQIPFGNDKQKSKNKSGSFTSLRMTSPFSEDDFFSSENVLTMGAG
jgi:hypothetical protein